MSPSNRFKLEPDSNLRKELLSVSRDISDRKKEIRALRKRQNELLASISKRHLDNPSDEGTKRLLRNLAAV